MRASDLLFLFFFLDMVSFNKKYYQTCTADYMMLYITTFSVHGKLRCAFLNFIFLFNFIEIQSIYNKHHPF